MFKKRMKTWKIEKNMTAARKEQDLKKLTGKSVMPSNVLRGPPQRLDRILRYAQTQFKDGRLDLESLRRLRESYKHARNDGFERRRQQVFNYALQNLHAALLDTDVEQGHLRSTGSNQEGDEQVVLDETEDATVDLFRALGVCFDLFDPKPPRQCAEEIKDFVYMMEDIRIYLGLDAFTKSCSLVEATYATYQSFQDNGRAAFLALLPHLSTESWYTAQVMEVLALSICRAITSTFDEGHPMSQAAELLLRKLPTVSEQSVFWRRSAKRYSGQILYSLDTWCLSVLSHIRFARRSGSLKIAFDSCEQAIYTLMKHNISSHGIRAQLLFEYARTLQVSHNWPHAIVIYPQALRYAELANDRRLATKTRIRLAQVYDHGLSDLSKAKVHYFQALAVAMDVFGTDHSHTMLAFVQLRGFHRRQPSTTMDMVGGELYKAACAHYASINDLVTEDGETMKEMPGER